ncbi:MAG: hypothetical protein HY741_11520 [Chloroflexi bacterium]|nr:hypothetical protein [Chloroflexota bacterium]
MTANELVQWGTEIVNAAAAQGITLRLSGGVAIYARCPSIETHKTLQRHNADLDFVAAANGWSRLTEFFTTRGWTKKSDAPTEIKFVKNGVTVEIQSPTQREDFAFDFSTRLDVTPLTLPLADLLLIKLARVNFKEKDMQDAAALLVDHRVTDGGDEAEDINREYLYHIINKDYHLWKTVFENTVTLEKGFDKYLEPEEAQLAWRRTELLQEVLDGKRHSLSWWAGRVLTR